MSDNHTFIVLHSDRYLRAIERAMYDFTRPFRVIQSTPHDGDKYVEMEGIPTPIDRKRMEHILRSIYHEKLSQAVHYMRYESAIVGIAQGLFDTPDPTLNQLNAVESLFICHPHMDELDVDIMCDFQAVRKQGWRQWKLIHNHKMFALLGGKDFRVMEWEVANNVHGGVMGEADDYCLDLSSLVNYVVNTHNSLPDHQGPIDWMHGLYIVHMTLMETLPNVSIERGDYSYTPFVNEMWVQETIVKPALQSVLMLSMNELPQGCDDVSHHTHYSGLLRRDGQLIIQVASHSPHKEERQRQEVMESILNQDYVPERMRRMHNLL